MRCNKKMLCDIFIETANERDYLATAKVEENKDVSIKWTRYEPRKIKINEDMIEVNRLWIEFMIPDYFVYMSEEAVRELAVYVMERIKGNDNKSTPIFTNEILSDKFRKRNLKRFLKRHNCVDTYDEKLMPIVSRMKENDPELPDITVKVSGDIKEKYKVSPIMNTILIDMNTAMKEEDELEDLIYTAICKIKDEREFHEIKNIRCKVKV